MAYKQMYQVNIHDYIQMEKIKHAKALLLKGEPVSTVAENVGYLNVSHFIRAFKKITGKTPTAFKRQPHWTKRTFLFFKMVAIVSNTIGIFVMKINKTIGHKIPIIAKTLLFHYARLKEGIALKRNH